MLINNNKSSDTIFLKKIILFLVFTLFLTACSDQPWNNPYPASDSGKNILYSSFSERPKHLDPARAYSSDEFAIIGQIYEPPLQYHYLKRPYQLEPLTLTSMPKVQYFDKQGKKVGESSNRVAYSVYELEIKPHILFHRHPAFAKTAEGDYRYLNLTKQDVKDIYQLSDFTQTDTRELLADDYIYQIKRLANPQFHSPIMGLMGEYIVGLSDLSEQLKEKIKTNEKDQWINLNNYSLAGVKKLGKYRFSIKIKGKYPQFLYWLSMPFFAPMPYEAERFYHQSVLTDKNITLDWYPIGTGAFELAVNNPNKQMILSKNEQFRDVYYPTEGMASDKAEGLLKDAGKKLPMVDKVVFTLEKESIPYWNKFLQGYYDNSGISSSSFDQVINMSSDGSVGLTDAMKQQGISLKTSISPSIFYFGFNMLDETVGGYDDRARKLRQAIAIAVDYDEYISIFLNGRGLVAQSPIPPGIFGYQQGEQGINPVLYDWRNGKAVKKPLSVAKRLLAEAGYKNGMDAKTGKALVLYLDSTGSGPDSKSRLAWWRKQFAKLNIQLVIRSSDYNRFRSKMLKGTAQLFMWGWNADYPDPENFLFLLYGPNGKVEHQGENAANYSNPEFDRLFEQMKDMPNSAERQAMIKQAIKIVQNDSPWLWGIIPKGFSLYHQWYFNAKPNAMAHNTLMYKRIDAALREQKQKQWNHPIVWPVIIVLLILIVSLIPAWRYWLASEQRSIRGKN